jgi:hypothetical protein
MDPQELKDNFSSQLDKARSELDRLRKAVAQREAHVLKLEGAVEAMDLQLSSLPQAVSEHVS